MKELVCHWVNVILRDTFYLAEHRHVLLGSEFSPENVKLRHHSHDQTNVINLGLHIEAAYLCRALSWSQDSSEHAEES